jgi:hypothetical protein
MRAIPSHLAIAIAAAPMLAFAATTAQAQPVPDQRLTPNIQGVPQMLQRVEQGVADVGALSETLRAVDAQVDLRSPIGFTNVYRVPGRPDLLMRSSGAVYAIFPQSSYVHMDRGLTAIVPAGTTFSIGFPGPLQAPPSVVSPMFAPKVMPAGSGIDVLAPSDTSSALRRDQRVNTMLMVDENGRVFEPTALDRQNWGQSQSQGHPRDLAEVRYHQFTTAQPPEPGTILHTIVTDEQYRVRRLAELLQRAAARASGDGEDDG